MNYENLKKLLFKLDPEIAHEMATFGLNLSSNLPFVSNIIQKTFCFKDEILSQNLCDINFPNPVGIGGGFDKNAVLVKSLRNLGFGFVEVGTITPAPQSGNPKPRLFRLIEEESLQNAMGFNNDGTLKAKSRLNKVYPFELPIFANIGKNKTTANENAIRDYEFCTANLDGVCDFFVINISSPNTPNLRDLQTSSFLDELSSAIKNITNKPLILKIAPDMSEKDAINLCNKAAELDFKALILNNTSIDYTLSPNSFSFGGISGQLIKAKSKKLFEAVSKELFGKIVLISCGGINTVDEVYDRIKMGANLVEIYTAFIYKGPSICKNINQMLSNYLRNDGFSSISEAVGVNLRK